jgi:hypothetical protein
MPENEKPKAAEVSDATPAAPEPGMLDDESLEQVAGGMIPSVPRIERAPTLGSLSTPVCLSQT